MSNSSNDSIQKTLIVTLLLCLFCSIVVSTAAVVLKPAQQKNIELDMKRNILQAAGMYTEGDDIAAQFASIQTKVVDLSSGQYSEAVDAETYVPRSAAKDPAMSSKLDNKTDIAKIGRLEKYALVYLVTNSDGSLDKVILPVRGYGLWSTLHGFLALESDLNTVVGFGFYEHGETPGLGGEVDNPKWKALWPGKKVFKQGVPELTLIKGKVDPQRAGAEYQVDGLSGATLTAKGVSNLIQFWMGENGYAKFLKNLKSGSA